jgi:hypothetical protein
MRVLVSILLFASLAFSQSLTEVQQLKLQNSLKDIQIADLQLKALQKEYKEKVQTFQETLKAISSEVDAKYEIQLKDGEFVLVEKDDKPAHSSGK